MAECWLVRLFDGRCERQVLNGGSPNAAAGISRAVGKNSPNVPDDVRVVQSLLNDVPHGEGGPDPKLAVDGLCWGRTTAAIHRFQKTFMKWPDERVDPGGKTLIRLNARRDAAGGPVLALSGTNGPVDPLPNPYIVPIIIMLVPEARQWIRAALFELDRAAPYMHGNPGGVFARERATRVRRLNHNFRLDDSPNRRRDFAFIREHFNRMERSLRVRPSHAETELMSIFRANTLIRMESTAGAYTYQGGYRQLLRPGPAPRDPALGVTRDRIYICSNLAQHNDFHRVRYIVHELAHFVSDPGHDGIGDHGYGLSDGKSIGALGPYHRLRTAECYANFAMDCRFGVN